MVLHLLQVGAKKNLNFSRLDLRELSSGIERTMSRIKIISQENEIETEQSKHNQEHRMKT